MKCEDVKKQIDLGLLEGGIEVSADIKSHFDNCDSCLTCYRESEALRETLNTQVFEVDDGELDDITFENLIETDKTVPARQRFRIAIPDILRWIWAPGAAAAVIAFIIMLSRDRIPIPVTDQNSLTELRLSWDEIYTAAENGAVFSRIAEYLEPYEDEFSQAADELSSGLTIDETLENLTDDELANLYKKIDNLKGST